MLGLVVLAALLMSGLRLHAQANCNPVKIVEWNIANCVAFWPDNIDYTEFQPAYPNAGGCISTSASNIYRNQGSHSCNYGRANGPGNAFCVGGMTHPNYVANDPGAIRFTVDFAAGDQGKLTQFDFWEMSTNPVTQINVSSLIPNNYPTQYGLRIMKNGVEIFRQIQPTSQPWSLEQFDFTNNPAFEFVGPVQFEFELNAFAPCGCSSSPYTIWDVDDFAIYACCQVCDPVTNGGGIAGDEDNCGGYDPGLISSTSGATGGTGALEYIWIQNSTPNNSGATTISGATSTTYDPGPITQTTYYRRLSRRSGCTTYDGETNWVVKEVDNPPVLACTSVDVSCAGGNDGSATANVTQGSAPYTYAWSNGGTTSTISNLAGGQSYSVTVTDVNGCTSTCSRFIADPSPLVITTSSTDASCFGGSDGTAAVVATGGTPLYGYNWSNGGTTASISGLSAGTYGVTVTDANGCSTAGIVSLGQPTAVAGAVTTSDASCAGIADGDASVAASGGTAPYTYLWSNGGTSVTISNLVAGSYSVTITDANGCTAVATGAVNSPGSIVATSSGTNVTCNGLGDGSASVSATGGVPPYTYAWSNGGTTPGISGLSGGTYTVTVSDQGSCSVIETVVVTEPNLLFNSVNFSDVTCNGFANGAASVTTQGGTAPYAYLWSNGSTSSFIGNLSGGTYNVTVTDANGCTRLSTVVLFEPPVLTNQASSTNASCFGFTDGALGSTVGGGTPIYSYAWSNGATTPNVGNVAPGSYTLTITDANGCTATSNTTVGQPTALNVVESATDISCAGANDGTASVAVSGGTPSYAYNWSTGATTANISNLSDGSYSVTVTDANQCTESKQMTVSEPAPLFASTSFMDPSCFGFANGSATVNPSGGTAPYSYLWSNGQTSQMASGLGDGSYSVTITDAGGCTTSRTVFLFEPPLLIASVTPTTDSCMLGIGSVTSTVSGGTPVYSYAWSNGAVTPNISGLMGGSYDLTVTDAAGCVEVRSALVGNIAPPANCDIQPGEFRTENQSAWGVNPLGNNAGAYLHANFSGAFPGGLVIGCNNTVQFTTAQSITNYLPCGGTNSTLNTSLIDPSCQSNSILSNLMAAVLNVEFDRFDVNFGGSVTNLGDLVLAAGPLAGLSVDEVILEANNAIGNCGSQYSLSNLNAALTVINQNFTAGAIANADLECPNPCAAPAAQGPYQGPPTMRMAAFPNPFTNTVTVVADLPEGGEGEFNIYGMDGSRMSNPQPQGYMEAGRHSFTWDGASRSGTPVTEGLYFIELRVGDQRITTKVLKR